jgi:hypothetical protein
MKKAEVGITVLVSWLGIGYRTLNADSNIIVDREREPDFLATQLRISELKMNRAVSVVSPYVVVVVTRHEVSIIVTRNPSRLFHH